MPVLPALQAQMLKVSWMFAAVAHSAAGRVRLLRPRTLQHVELSPVPLQPAVVQQPRPPQRAGEAASQERLVRDDAVEPRPRLFRRDATQAEHAWAEAA